MRGRRPDSAAVQEAKGHPRKQRRKTVDDAVEAAPMPDGTPGHLSENARKFWARVAPELLRINFVRVTDRPSLERYCETLAKYWEIQLKLRGRDLVYWTESLHGKMKRIEPMFLLLQRVETMLFNYEDRLGLNPAARQRILLGMAGVQGNLNFLNQPDAKKRDGDGEQQQPGGGAGERIGSPVGMLGRMH